MDRLICTCMSPTIYQQPNIASMYYNSLDIRIPQEVLKVWHAMDTHMLACELYMTDVTTTECLFCFSQQ